MQMTENHSQVRACSGSSLEPAASIPAGGKGCAGSSGSTMSSTVEPPETH